MVDTAGFTDDDGNGIVDVDDMLVVIAEWGQPGGDLNGDGIEDMAITSWGEIALLESDPGGWARTGHLRGLTVDDTRPVGWGIEFVDVQGQAWCFGCF